MTTSDTPEEWRSVYERISIGESSEVSTVRGHRRDCAQRRGDGPLELVDAHPVWNARDHVLAGRRGAGAQPDPVRSLRWTRPADALALSDDRALESDDDRGTREVHGRHERTLRQIRVAGPRVGCLINSQRPWGDVGVLSRWPLRDQ